MNVPTIAKTNCTSSYAVAIEQAETAGIEDLLADNSASLSMLYASGKLIVRGQANEKTKVNIYSNIGQLAATFTVQLNGGYAEISVEGLPTGYFVAETTDQHDGHAVCKFIKR